jgi:hypothetical protein
VRVVPNPAPPVGAIASREELRRRFGLSGPTLVFAGRFVEQKDVPLAIAALREAPAATLVLVGDGPERTAIDAAVRDGGVGHRVRVEPAVDRNGAMEWMRAADAVVLPSRWENFPHAAVEALAVGTPIIATAVGGVPEIVEDGVNGVLVPPNDPRSLGAAMAALTSGDESELRRLRRGAERDAGRFDVETTFTAIRSVLMEAAKPRVERPTTQRRVTTRADGGLEASTAPRWSVIADLVGPSPGAVLDVGCRDRALEKHLPAGTRYVGVDLFPPADVIASAEQRLPFEDGSFDVVVFADVLEHLDDPHGAIDDGLRIARRAVIVLLPNMYTAWNRMQFVRGRLSTQKYALTVEAIRDRHRWFPSYDEARAFVRGRAAAGGWHVEREVAHTPAFRRPGTRLTYGLARHLGGPMLWAWEYAARVVPDAPPRAGTPAAEPTI